MSSRVGGPRTGAPIGVGRHKQDNERRNQALQKRSLDGPLSKSLTEDPNARARPRKKGSDPLAGKSFMKSTSSSSLKKAMDSRDVSPSNVKKRVSSPTSVMSKSDHQVMSKSDHQVELRRSSSRRSVDNSNRLSVFERLSKTNCNKEANKVDAAQSSKSTDRKGVDKTSVKRRSGVFSDNTSERRKSGMYSDNAIDKRKSGVFSDTSGAAPVPLRRDSNVRRSGRGTGNRDSRAEISEKHKGEEKPESSDKDAKEECISTTIKGNESHQQQHVALAPAGRHVGAAATTAAHQPLMGGAGDEGAAAVAGRDPVMPAATATVGPVPAPAVRPATSTAPPNHSQQQAKRPATGDTHKTKPKDTTHKAATPAGANRPTTGKAPVTGTKPEAVTDAKKLSTADVGKQPQSKTQKHTVPVAADSKANSPSVAAVSRLAERVITGQVKPNKDGDTKVLDDDKDVCDDDKASEDREFYRIKVQTRLVSYENNTLVIKNTAKPQATLSDEEENEDPEQCHESCPGTADAGSSNSSLQTSSAEAASPVGGSSDHTGALTQGHHGEEMDDDATQEDEGEFTRSRSLRLKMSNFMNKGKNFLSDVYSSTQQSLQPHLNQLPEMTRSFQHKMSRSLTSECSSSDALSLMSFSSSISSHEDRVDSSSLPAADTDSGYYSIHTSPDQGPHTPLPDTEDLDDTLEINTSTDILTQVLTEPSVHPEGDDPSPASYMEYAGTPDDNAPEILINDDWFKRCIVNCTCQCRPKDLTSPSEGSLDSGHGSDEGASTDNNDDQCGAQEELVLPPSGTSGGGDANVSATATAAVSSPSDDSISRGECSCECHGGYDVIPNIQQQVPKEVQEILDHDHARMWWTITGNFGNILPIDWSKTYTRQQYLPVLNLNEAKDNCNNESDEGEGGEEEEVAQDLDLHHLILSGLNEEPVKSAEEVIREIDDIMQEGSSSEDEGLEETMSCSTETQSTQPEMRPLPPPLYEEKLKNLSVNELNEHYMELEVVIRQYSETLINQLALRDELEYEKELKNSFISLLLQVQNKRRNFNVEKKQKKKYLTTVIPYDVGHGPPSNQTLQILIKILTAINEDSPTVPTLLTDYILKVLCPS